MYPPTSKLAPASSLFYVNAPTLAEESVYVNAPTLAEESVYVKASAPAEESFFVSDSKAKSRRILNKQTPLTTFSIGY